MTKTNTMSAGLLGDDPGQDITITTPDGAKIEMPAAMAGEFFAGSYSTHSGEPHHAGDDEEITGDLHSLLGDNPILNVGDVFSGDPAKRKKSGIYASLLPATTVSKLPATDKAAYKTLKAIPGALTSTRNLSPVIISNGMINVAPTRNMVQGAYFVDTIRRFETQYPGTTRTKQSTTTTAANLTFTFAAPIAAEGGNTVMTPVILIAISTQRNYQVANVELGISLTAVNESSQAVNSQQWTVLLSEDTKSCFLAIIPFTEISSTIYPAICQASATNNLTLNLYNVPANTNVKVVLPGPDSSQYQFFKESMGISRPTTGAMNLNVQGQ